MAINVTTKWIYPPTAPSTGLHRRAIVNLTANATDGTDEAAVTKIDRSAIIGHDGNMPQKIAIEKVQFHVVNFEVLLYWIEAGGDETICFLSGGTGTEDNSVAGEFDWIQGGGNGLLPPAVPAAATDGDIAITTSGADDYASYNITLSLRFKCWKPGDTVV